MVRADVPRRKRERPFASGDLPLTYGLAGLLLVLVGLAVALTVNTGSLFVLATTGAPGL